MAQMNNDIANLLGSLDGSTIEGGCDYCEATQTMRTESGNLFILDVTHEPECPTLKDEPPIVQARRRIDGQLVIVCPHCGKKHYHSGGKSIGDGDGHRSSHCTDEKNSGYILKEVE